MCSFFFSKKRGFYSQELSIYLKIENSMSYKTRVPRTFTDLYDVKEMKSDNFEFRLNKLFHFILTHYLTLVFFFSRK